MHRASVIGAQHMTANITAELVNFGIERELEYLGHITQANHLVPLPRRTFASADETHLRVWSAKGDIVKKTFPSNRRSMVCAMSQCPVYSALLTAEIDMSVKAYDVQTLALLDTFYIEALRNDQHSQEKISALAYIGNLSSILLGGDKGLELWRLSRSTQRRSSTVGRMEYHLKLEWTRQVADDDVLGLVVDAPESRVVVWGRRAFYVYDKEDMTSLARYNKPHAEPMRCACIRVVSQLETLLLSGGEDGAVNFWSIQGSTHLESKSSQTVAEADDGRQGKIVSFVRLEHSFQGHARPVEVVCFYHKVEGGSRQRLCVSYGRDGKMRVWSLVQFSIVYALDIPLLDMKASIFPLGSHYFAVSALQEGGKGGGNDGGQRATLTLARFTAQFAMPFATTNQSPVAIIAQPPPPSDRVSTAEDEPVGPWDSVVLVSEDMAVRIVDGSTTRVTSTLPPPPVSKVQILAVFICPVWQLIVLWMSSQEIAIFFVPGKAKTVGEQQQSQQLGDDSGGSAPSSPSAARQAASSRSSGVRGDARATSSTTPLLLRRFSILEVVTKSPDKKLAKEAFHSVALHYGPPPQAWDYMTQVGFTYAAPPVEDESQTMAGANASNQSDWFLLVGTKIGTVQAFRLSDILRASPIWGRISAHLPPTVWMHTATVTSPSHVRDAAEPTPGEKRNQAFTEEHIAQMEASRVPGQRPFPRGATPLLVYGRWRCHDYPVEVVESFGSRLLTIDGKRNLKLYTLQNMQCVFCSRLAEFSCRVRYLQPQIFEDHVSEKTESGRGTRASTPEAGGPQGKLVLAGVAVGLATGFIQLIAKFDEEDEEPATMVSPSSHGSAPLDIDFTWPANVFVSIGRDDTVRIWNRNLVLLKDIVFPQPLTAVAFRRTPWMQDGKRQGHGDVLVGFGAHVEAISYEFWTRGLPESVLGTDSNSVSDEAPRRTEYMIGGRKLLTSDDINDHIDYLHSSEPQDVLTYKEQVKGVNVLGAGMVATFARKLSENVKIHKNVHEAEQDVIQAKKERLQNGEVLDFRGAPCVQVGDLSGQVAEVSGVQARRLQGNFQSEHSRSDTLDRGDFKSITRTNMGYYDWTVCPSSVVDAPRFQAIRGSCGADGVAMVTSLGLGHMRLPDLPPEFEASKQEISPSELQGKPPVGDTQHQISAISGSSDSLSQLPQPVAAAVAPRQASQPATKQLNQSAASTHAAATMAGPTGSSKPAKATSSNVEGSKMLENSTSSITASAARPSSAAVPSTERPKSVKPTTDDDSDDEPWRRKRIARGVPARENHDSRPRGQAVANTDSDTARMLCARHDVEEVPDVQEDNLLKSLFKKKQDWLYCKPRSNIMSTRRHTIKEQQHLNTGPTWTSNGRLINAEDCPPKRAVPAVLQFDASTYMKPRMPMTRSERTEQRIIEAAKRPPPRPPCLALASEISAAQLPVLAPAPPAEPRGARPPPRRWQGSMASSTGSPRAQSPTAEMSSVLTS